MIILGVHDGHDASAALLKDGEVVAAAQEERWSGIKGDYGLPFNAIQYCLKFAPRGVDRVAVASHKTNPIFIWCKRNASYAVEDWLDEQRHYWYSKLFLGLDRPYQNILLGKSFPQDSYYGLEEHGVIDSYNSDADMEKIKEIRKGQIAARFDLDPARIGFVTHEDCHHYYSYFGSHLNGRGCFSLTSEGTGDYSNGSVGYFEENRAFDVLSHTLDNHIGHIFHFMCLVLGMRPARDEHKVMGLAPYASSREVQKSLEVFDGILAVRGTNIEYGPKRPPDFYNFLRRRLEGHRFDGMAGAVQKWTEDLLCEWVARIHERYGKPGERISLVFAGGVAQNIKAAGKMAALDCVKDFSVMPAAGDTSLSIGACYATASKYYRADMPIRPLTNIYLGPEFSDEECYQAIQAEGVDGQRVDDPSLQTRFASAILEGKIVGRCSGRMEFGLRALGNRSILADPSNPEMVKKINDAVKKRDFWMPFTCSIQQQHVDEYLVNGKGLQCPYMTLAFDTLPGKRRDLVSAIHPADFTARPQMLSLEQNPQYYGLIEKFRTRSHIPAVLNTSLNIHGDPINLGPQQALRTFKASGMDHLILNNFWISKKD